MEELLTHCWLQAALEGADREEYKDYPDAFLMREWVKNRPLRHVLKEIALKLQEKGVQLPQGQ